MRLWSVHPRYLDPAGLNACWREALLAKKVLMGQTKGYKNHPQLNRFKAQKIPIEAINNYLHGLYQEACCRGYHFQKEKIGTYNPLVVINVTQGQLNYEWKHLQKKLHNRNADYANRISITTSIEPHPLFCIIEGEIEPWERLNDSEK